MQPSELFALGLGLTPPWKITDLEFVDGEVHVHVDFEKGAKFDGDDVHDTSQREWRHLNFFKYPCYVHARVPRVKGDDGKVTTVQVPWAKPGSGFTTEFEELAVELFSSMPVSCAASILKVTDTRLWRLLRGYVKRCRDDAVFAQPRRVGVDETSARKGHDYVTVFVDLDARRVLFACPGKDGGALDQFRSFLESRGLDPRLVESFACDMGPAFISGIHRVFPDASVTLDRFHLVALVSRALDQTRRAETKGQKDRKKTRWLWLKNPSKLRADEKSRFKEILDGDVFPLTGKAYSLKLAFQDLFRQSLEESRQAFYEWVGMAFSSEVPAMVSAAVTLFNHASMVLQWFETRISTGLLEGLHSVLQATKDKARGYRNPENLIAMSYLLHGQLKPATHTK